ncbi:hypothetical protein KY285_019191 [Solanum tuberosum]|nr:hypothetical protein KY285_019191 [Solanum tuberosum]
MEKKRCLYKGKSRIYDFWGENPDEEQGGQLLHRKLLFVDISDCRCLDVFGFASGRRRRVWAVGSRYCFCMKRKKNEEYWGRGTGYVRIATVDVLLNGIVGSFLLWADGLGI